MSIFLETFFQYAENIFQFLIINSIYSALLVVVILLSKLLIPKLPRCIEYGLWCLVLIRLILPTDFSISYSLGYLSHNWINSELPIIISQTNWLAEFVNQEQLFSFSLFQWLLLLWSSLSLFVAIKYILLKIKLANVLSSADPIEENWIVNEVNYWRKEFQIKREIIVISSNDFLSPFTFAIFTPVIFIPKQILLEKNQSMIRSIISHELSHVKRLDAAWLIFQNAVQIIYCLNPILWLAVRRLSSLREEICDQNVLNTGKVSKDDYGRSLLNVLRMNLWSKKAERSPELFAAFFLSHKKMFKKRISAIANNKKLKLKPIFQRLAVASFALFFLPMSWQNVVIKKQALAVEIEEVQSPFPDHIRKNYKAPVLIKPNDSPY